MDNGRKDRGYMKQNCYLSTAVCFFHKVIRVLTLFQRLENSPFSDACKQLSSIAQRDRTITKLYKRVMPIKYKRWENAEKCGFSYIVFLIKDAWTSLYRYVT